MADELTDIKKLLKTENLMIGTDRTLKELKLGKISKVYLTSNCPKDIMETIEHYKKVSDIEVAKLDIPNDELGTFCKKPFPISVLSVKK